MLDFLRISTRPTKSGTIEIFPKFIVGKSKDLMIRGGDFYAIWLEDKHLWSTDEQDVIDYIDRELDKYAEEYRKKTGVQLLTIQTMWDSDSGMINKWHTYCQKQMRDNFKPLDQKVLFANDNPVKEDYATRTLNYSLEPGDTEAYDEIMNTLYSPDNRHKIEWSIGAIVTGASKKIQKFLVLYGEKGTGKSTIINIIQKLFDGYYSVFDAKAIGSASNTFALEAFKDNPLIAIQHDGDLSHIDDNTRINSLTAHEKMIINEKHKSTYDMKIISFLIMGTNNPVKITDSKSGILRRMIDANPTGNKLPVSAYNKALKKIEFELGHIANHCKEVYESDPGYYDDYTPINMMGETNDFFNFMEDSYIIFKKENQVTLREAWEMYKEYCEQAKVQYPFPMRLVKAELKTYFYHFEEDHYDEDTNMHIKNLYTGFKYEIFDKKPDKKKNDNQTVGEENPTITDLIELKSQASNFDIECKDCLAQYATSAETPGKKWENVNTTLTNIITTKLHYVKPPENHIVIDFDIKDETGKKSFKKNLEAASKWPKTYAELSKSGSGIHLHYIYDGDVNKLSRIYDDNIEIKVFTGGSALRRKLTKCNNEEIRHISSGLPLKGNAEKMESIDIIKNEKVLRTMIKRNLNKEYMGATKPSMDFIKKLLDDAYDSGMKYDVSDMYNLILAFAASSTNQSDYCLSLIGKMHFKSEEMSESTDEEKPIVIFDCEVFPNLLLVNWKLLGKEHTVVRMINPKPHDIEDLLQYRLVGFNNRKYDNHILYARLLGKTNEEIYKLSQDIINQKKNAMFGQAYNLSYTDIYDYSTKKQSLKKWEIELGINHLELGLPWDKPVPKELWPKVAEYCDNDVISTEAVWYATEEDFKARQILADIAGMSVNDTTNSLTTRIIFGYEKKPLLVYTDLSTQFPGYEFVKKWNDKTNTYDKFNMYRGIDLGFGGYVDAKEGIFTNVALLDIASMHPHSTIALNMFGEYTKRYKDLVETRVYVKHGEYDKAKELFDGKLVPYLTDESNAKKLSGALKLPINSVYGLTSAKFDNPFRDPRNENNIVALRGALFMKTLKDEVEARGFEVCHIKTDSIKIPNATKEIIDFCMSFAKQYGYTFEHEATYEKMCLINDAVYIAKYSSEEDCLARYGYVPDKNKKEAKKWTATGIDFQVPYVFKKCFSKEPIVFDDMCEVKEVKSAIYLDYNEDKDNSMESTYQKILDIRATVAKDGENAKLTKPQIKLLEDWSNVSDEELKTKISECHDYRFVGRVGYFCPIKPGCGGAMLVAERLKKDDNIGYDAVTGTKGYRWLEAANVKGIREQDIDKSYYENLVNKAIETISKYGDYYWFAE